MIDQKHSINYRCKTISAQNSNDFFNDRIINDNNQHVEIRFSKRERLPNLTKNRKPMIYTFYSNKRTRRNKSTANTRSREMIDDIHPFESANQIVKSNNNNVNHSVNPTLYSSINSSPTDICSTANLTLKFNDNKFKSNEEDNYYKILFHQVKGHNFLLLNQLKEHENFESMIQSLENKNKELKDENTELKNNKSEIENEHLQLNEKLNEFEKEKEINEQKILNEKEIAGNKIAELENKIREMEIEIINSESKIKELKNKIENNENTINDLNTENKLLKQETDDLEKIKNEINKNVFNDSKDILLQKAISMEILNGDEKTKKDLSNENELLHIKNDELSKELNTIMLEKEEKEKLIESEKEQIYLKNNQLNEELNLLKSEKIDQEKKITDLTNQLQQAENNYQKCVDEINAIKNNNIYLIKENENLKLTQTKNEETITELQKQQQAFNEYNELKNRNTLLSEENNKLEQKKSILESHCNGLKELVDLSNDDLKLKILNLKENNDLLLKRLEESDRKKDEFERKLIKLQSTFNEQLEEEKKDFIGLYNKRKRDMENNISFGEEEEDKELINSLVDRKSENMKQQNKINLLKNENRALKEVVNDLKSKIIVMKGNNSNNSINSIKNSQNEEIINSLKNENNILAKEKQIVNNYLTNSNNEIANLQQIINDKDQLINNLNYQIQEYQNKIRELEKENERKLQNENQVNCNLPNADEIINHENNNLNNMNGNNNINFDYNQELEEENKMKTYNQNNEIKMPSLNENNLIYNENEESKEPDSQNHSIQQNVNEKKTINESHSRCETASMKKYIDENNEQNNNNQHQENNDDQNQDNNQENIENNKNSIEDFNQNDDLIQSDSQSQNKDLKSKSSLNSNNNQESKEADLQHHEINLENNESSNQKEVNGGNKSVNEKKSLTQNEVLGIETQNQEINVENRKSF